MSRLISTCSQVSDEHLHQLATSFCTQFKMEFFSFGRMYDDGSCLFFSTNTRIMEYLFENKYPLFSPVQLNFIQEKFAYFLNDEGPYQKVMHEVRSYFNLGNAIDFFECHEGYVDVCCFGANPQEKNMFNIYLNNLKKMENFMDYFRQKFNTSLKRLSNKAILLPDEMRLNFTSQAATCTPLTYIDTGYTITFSKRESEVIKLLGLGKTTKKIAQQLNLSPRTVEGYLENIKSKTFCSSKSELMEKIITIF